MKKMLGKYWGKWLILFKVLPIVLAVILLKIISHRFGYEIMDLNSLFTTLIGGTIFLLGFLVGGVLSDYKESEKIPSELSFSIEALFDMSYTIYKGKDSETAKQFIEYQKHFIISLKDWFYERESTESLLEKLSKMSDFFVALSKEKVEAGYITKMENDHSNIRKMILRAATIRDTEFVAVA